MKMTSDQDSTTVKKEFRDGDKTPPCKINISSLPPQTNRGAKLKHRLTTFSIDSLVGGRNAHQNEPAEKQLDAIPNDTANAQNGSQPRSRSRSPISKHESDHQSRHARRQNPKPSINDPRIQKLDDDGRIQKRDNDDRHQKSLPTNGPEWGSISDHSDHLIRHSAFMPPPVSSGPSGSMFMAPNTVRPGGGRVCWDMMNGEPNMGLWKDAATASAMYQAAAAALYAGYPWYAPSGPMVPNDMVKKHQLLLQHDPAGMNLLMDPSSPIGCPESSRHNVGISSTNPLMTTSGPADPQQTFWHHHIAELLRQNGGHPIHHSRMCAGPEASGHATTSFLFSACRKPKRIRTAFLPNQLMELEAAFEKNQYVVGNERKELARRLALTETQVKVWFQNRRTKAKRMKNEDSGTGTPVASSSASAKITTGQDGTPDEDPTTSRYDSEESTNDRNASEMTRSGRKSSGGSTPQEPEESIEDEERENDEEMEYNTGEESE